jgi:hypothetical protein
VASHPARRERPAGVAPRPSSPNCRGRCKSVCRFAVARQGDLTPNANTVTKDLATKLRGAKVKLRGPGTQTVEGTLAGTQDFKEYTQQGIIDRFRVVVMADDGDFRTVEDRNIDTLVFTDETDRRETQKALQRSYQAIKPDSAFVDLTIVANQGATRCAVQYATTAPSPKTRYQLRQLSDK